MRLKNLLAAAAALSLVVAPAWASPRNPAASLSVAKSVRATAPAKARNHLGGSGLVIGLMAAVLVGAIVIAIDTDDNGASDSN